MHPFKKEYEFIEDHLYTYLPSKDHLAKKLYEAMYYALASGGKRFRPMLVLFSAQMKGLDSNDVIAAACAMEYIHSASLILDDLPCMDDAKLRRGKTATHLVFGEDQTILAAFSLFSCAYNQIVQCARHCGLSSDEIAELIAQIAYATGYEGLCGGQSLDLELPLLGGDIEKLHHVHARKTGALFVLSTTLGARLAKAEDTLIEALEAFGTNLGLAFQIVDDILDVTASTTTIGKDTGKDAGKPTFASCLAIDEACREAKERIDVACKALLPWEEKATPFLQLANRVLIPLLQATSSSSTSE